MRTRGLSGSGDGVENKQRGPAVSHIAHLSLISLPKANIKHSHWLWIRVRQSRWLFYQLEFADIFDCVSDWLEELTRHKQLARAQWQIWVELKHKTNCTHKDSNVFISTCFGAFVWSYTVMEHYIAFLLCLMIGKIRGCKDYIHMHSNCNLNTPQFLQNKIQTIIKKCAYFLNFWNSFWTQEASSLKPPGGSFSRQQLTEIGELALIAGALHSLL